jgi:hypothetical protein
MLFKQGRTMGAVAALVMIVSAAQAGTFPDYGYAPPSSYTGPTFLLSQDYPKTLPAGEPEFFKLLPKDFSNDFETWRPYVDAVKKYCLDGNVQSDWYVQNNQVRKWYHAPWQHYGPAGREGIHGLTKEAQIQSQQLALTQTTTGQTYAVGIYNDIGGYTFGEVWKDPQNPDPSYTSKPNSFHNGTVVCKALFADIDLKQVPFLANPVLWQGYITDSYNSANRMLKNVALIQMDFAVRDTRVGGTGWLFGTFQYNGAITGKPSWDNLIPVGIMWGNDPNVTANDFTNPHPGVTRINPQIKESAINANTKELPPTHLGWNPTFQANPPPVGSPAWMRWFQNLPAGVPFDAAALSTDYSLQLAGGIQNFYDWKCLQGGVFASGPNACQQAKNFRLKLMKSVTPPPKIYRVERDATLNELH